MREPGLDVDLSLPDLTTSRLTGELVWSQRRHLQRQHRPELDSGEDTVPCYRVVWIQMQGRTRIRLTEGLINFMKIGGFLPDDSPLVVSIQS